MIAKGQLDRAIREYEQVVGLDPADIKARQKLAELLVRVGRHKEAIAAYEAIGTFYADNGYHLKAIAVYKQIQKLDPADIRTAFKLAELNREYGFTGNALSEYGVVLLRYREAGDLEGSVAVLEKMIQIDSDNPDTRLLLAETRYDSGLTEEAYGDFTAHAMLLLRRGEMPAYDRACARIQKLFPDRNDYLLNMLSVRIDQGDAAGVLPQLRDLVATAPDDPKPWRLLADAYRSTADRAGLKSLFRKMSAQFITDPYPRQALIELMLEDGGGEEALSQLDIFVPDFIRISEFDVPERLYIALSERYPEYQARILQSVSELYEAGGDTAKLQEAVRRLQLLKGPDALAENGSPVSSAADPGEPYVAKEPEDEWEEELDLSLIDEVAQGGGPGVITPAFHDQVGGSDSCTGRAESSNPPSDAVEVEVDFGEDWGMMHEESVHGSGPVSGDADLPTFIEFSDAVDNLFGGGFAGGSPGEGFSGDLQLSPGATSGEERGGDDAQAHYDLGLAYKEMRLFDEAIAEFRMAAGDPLKKGVCLVLEGICYREKGEAQKAEEVLRAALSREGATQEEAAGASYELSRLCAAAGRSEEAELLLKQAASLSPDFRDLHVR